MSWFFPQPAERSSLEKIVAASPDWSLRLFKNNVAANEEHVLADFTEADFPGYAAVVPPTQDGDVETDGDGKARQWFELALFTLDLPDTETYSIYGAYIVGDDDLILCYERFSDAPKILSTTNPVLVLKPFITLNTA